VSGSGARHAGFNELIHQPTRLSVVALLAPAEWVEFAYLRDALEMSDSALSKQLTTLQEAGYVQVRRARQGAHRRVTVRLTSAGREAFGAHVAALQGLLGGVRATVTGATDE
jgi:DNA-binding MarR family transcriptional regulator